MSTRRTCSRFSMVCAGIVMSLAMLGMVHAASPIDTVNKCIRGCVCVSPWNCPCCGYGTLEPLDSQADPITVLSALQNAGLDVTARAVDEEIHTRQAVTSHSTRQYRVREDCSQYNTWWNALKTLVGIYDDWSACMCRNGATPYCEE